MDTTQAFPWGQEPPPAFPRIDQIEGAVREAAPQWGHEIRPPHLDRVLAPPSRLPAAIMAGGLLATLGLACIAGSSLHGFYSAAPPSPALVQNFNASARVSDSDAASTAGAPRIDREATPREPNHRRIVSAALRNARRESAPSPEAARQSIAATVPSSSTARQDTSTPKPAPSPVEGRTKILPVPETRPTTLPGWVIRDVTGGTAVLEGPTGVWRTTPGATVPGVGKVHFVVRWGGRWIVGTSRGLIATP
jgi:hypothetical protein